ncbi:TELO2-interacting protein 2-like [Babylonia areolata]|uniref:TELO2-interacting protein 2-like n=1 Tax=Babylonia areolata TaxID=304850 RepID=UPI003FD0FD5D
MTTETTTTALDSENESTGVTGSADITCLLNIMSAFKQIKCETERLDSLKAASEMIGNMNCKTKCSSSFVQLDAVLPDLEDVVQLAVPAPFPDRGHFMFEEEDFRSLTERTEVVLSFMNSVLEMCNHCGSPSVPTLLHGCLPHLLIVLSSNMRASLWFRDSLHNLTLQVLNQVRILYQVDSLMKLLHLDWKGKDRETATPNSCLLGQYLKAVRVRLTKEDWQASPTFVESFVWMLTQMIKFPHLSDYLHLVLPPALLFVDSHVTEHKVKGIRCLHHIAANVSNEQLRWYGRADVVYAALKHQIYSREAEIIRVLHPALLTVLPAIDTHLAQPQEVDLVLSSVSSNAVMESSLVLRRLYIRSVVNYVSYLGVRSVWHLNRLVSLASDYLEVCDGPQEEARLSALDLVSTVLRNAWPRVPPYAGKIVKSLLKLFQDLETGTYSATMGPVREKLCDQALSCLELLIEICPHVKACLRQVDQTPDLKMVSLKFQKLLES